MARKSTDHYEQCSIIVLVGQGIQGAATGAQTTMPPRQRLSIVEDGPWHGSRQELRFEKLRDGCLYTTLSSSDASNVSRPLEVSENDLTQGVPEALPDEKTVSSRCQPYATR